MPDTHITKNFAAHGGNEWVIGGKLTILEGAEVEGLETADGFPAAENQADSTATTIAELKADVNALLAKLKAAGLMAPDAAVDEGSGD